MKMFTYVTKCIKLDIENLQKKDQLGFLRIKSPVTILALRTIKLRQFGSKNHKVRVPIKCPQSQV